MLLAIFVILTYPLTAIIIPFIIKKFKLQIMCYRPLTISNPKLVRGLYDSPTLTVPCGHCEDCKEHRRIDAYLKLYYEWKDVQERDGFAYFLTLTYNQEHLPHTSFGVPCFNRKDISDYVKRVRAKLPDANIRYWYCGELGSLTRRPHYHIVFFVDNCPFFHFRNIATRMWRHVMLLSNHAKSNEYVDFGFTREGKFDNGCLTNASGLRYVAKYISKSQNLDKYLASQYKFICSKIGSNCPRSIDCKLVSEIRKAIYKKIQPFFLSSEKFGASMIQKNSIDDIMNSRVIAPDSKGLNKFYQLPLSIQRLIFFVQKRNFHGSISYHLNDLGLQNRELTFNSFFKAFANRVRCIASYPFSASQINHINYSFNHSFSSIHDILVNYDVLSLSGIQHMFMSSHVFRHLGSSSGGNYDIQLPLDSDLYLTKLECISNSLNPPKKSFERFKYAFNNISHNILSRTNEFMQIFNYLCNVLSKDMEIKRQVMYNQDEIYKSFLNINY